MTSTMLLNKFETGDLSLANLSHRDHIWLTWHYLANQTVPETMITMSRGLHALAAKAGKEKGFHQTVTCAWVGIIAARRFALAPDHRFEEFCQRNADLFDQQNRCVQAFYQRETLASTAARAHFLWPDNPGEITHSP